MSEAAAPVGAPSLPAGTHSRGRLVPDSECAQCHHGHERIETGQSFDVVWVAACWCGCRADRNEYEGIIVDISAWRPRSIADVVAPFARPALDGAGTHDDDHELCPVHHLAGACVELGHGDAGATDRVDARRSVRRGRLGRLFRAGVSRLAGNQRDQLVRERRMESSEGRRPGVPGLADHGGGADPAEPTGSERLRGVVKS